MFLDSALVVNTVNGDWNLEPEHLKVLCTTASALIKEFADSARWPSRSGDFADRFNTMPKYVVSSTLKDPSWNNTTVLAGDVVQVVSTLKEKLEGEIVVAGSIRLVRTLLEHDLVDELRLMIYPVVLGDGERLFAETSEPRPVRLVQTRAVDDLAYVTYAVAGEPA